MAESKKSVSFGEIVGVEKKLDPMDLDTREIQKLSDAIPKDGQIDINKAEILATRFLRGIDQCAELLTMATLMVSRAKDAKQKAYNYAFLVKSSDGDNKGKLKTDKLRTAFAELDEDYQSACDEYNKALAFHKWCDSKHASFSKAHYLCKRLLDRRIEQENADSWEGATPEDDNEW